MLLYSKAESILLFYYILVIFSPSGSTLRLAAPPLSLLQQPASQMSMSRPPTYVQAAPPIHPATTGLLTQAVGYNSLTSQGVEVVHQAIPLSRPLTSTQAHNADVPSSVQPILTGPSHQIAVEPPPATLVLSEAAPQAVPVSIQLGHTGYAQRPQPASSLITYQPGAAPVLSQPSAVVITSQLAPMSANQQAPVVANHLPLPVNTSQPPPSVINTHQPPAGDGHPPQGVPPPHIQIPDAINGQQIVMTSHPPPTVVSVPPPVIASQPSIITSMPVTVVTSQPPPGIESMPPTVINQQVITSIPPPVVTSQPPPVITSMPPPVVITNHPPPGAVPESRMVLVSQATAVVQEDAHVSMVRICGSMYTTSIIVCSLT